MSPNGMQLSSIRLRPLLRAEPLRSSIASMRCRSVNIKKFFIFSSAFCVLAAGALSAPLAAHADLLGDSIHVVVAFPTSTTSVLDLGNYAVPDTGTYPGVLSFTITQDTITLTATQPEGFNTAAFNGLEFTDITTDPGITSATFRPGFAFAGGVASFTGDEVFINLEGNTVTPGEQLIVDLGFDPAVPATPEPSSIALLGTGVLGLGGVLRRRFARA